MGRGSVLQVAEVKDHVRHILSILQGLTSTPTLATAAPTAPKIAAAAATPTIAAAITPAIPAVVSGQACAEAGPSASECEPPEPRAEAEWEQREPVMVSTPRL
eukprot:324031-Rhodomonas_salina.1